MIIGCHCHSVFSIFVCLFSLHQDSRSKGDVAIDVKALAVKSVSDQEREKAMRETEELMRVRTHRTVGVVA